MGINRAAPPPHLRCPTYIQKRIIGFVLQGGLFDAPIVVTSRWSSGLTIGQVAQACAQKRIRHISVPAGEKAPMHEKYAVEDSVWLVGKK